MNEPKIITNMSSSECPRCGYSFESSEHRQMCFDNHLSSNPTTQPTTQMNEDQKRVGEAAMKTAKLHGIEYDVKPTGRFHIRKAKAYSDLNGYNVEKKAEKWDRLGLYHNGVLHYTIAADGKSIYSNGLKLAEVQVIDRAQKKQINCEHNINDISKAYAVINQIEGLDSHSWKVERDALQKGFKAGAQWQHSDPVFIGEIVRQTLEYVIDNYDIEYDLDSITGLHPEIVNQIINKK